MESKTTSYKEVYDSNTGELDLAELIEQKAKSGEPLVITIPKEADQKVVAELTRMIIHDLSGGAR